MTTTEFNANFESVYESLCYDKVKFQDDPSSKAQVFRQIAAQQYYAAHSEIIDDDHEASLVAYEDTLKEYFKIMDEKEPSKGLDNCSRGVHALCSGFKNESKQWQLRDLKSNTLFQKLENELSLEAAASGGAQPSNFERTLELIMSLEGKLQGAVEKSYPSTATKMKSIETDISTDMNRTTLFASNTISQFLLQEKKDSVDSSSIFPRFTFQENKVPEDIPNSVTFRFSNQEKRIPEDLPASMPRFSFQEKKSAEDPTRVNKPPMIVERKQEDIRKPRYPSIVERKHEDSSRSGILPHRRADDTVKPTNSSAFRTAREQFVVDQKKKNSGNNGGYAPTSAPVYARSKSLGPRRTLNSPFVLPVKEQNKNDDNHSGASDSKNQSSSDSDKPIDERLKNIEPKMVELIENEIMDSGAPVHWDDIAGLEFAKNTIKEIVVWPMLRPDIFTGLRGPPRGILLFGPPGTGKTLIGKCIASQSRSTFFSISASSLTSKWVGEGEKMVRALFAVARVHQPSVIFIDEIDSLLSQRSDTEHESSRRIKTEFLVQLDGATTSSDDRLLVVGATNRPQELDEAARRRLVKRLYIPLPEFPARKQIIVHLMSAQRHVLGDEQVNEICQRTDGYSCADMTNLCKEAAFGPIRSISLEDIEFITPDQVRPITKKDFEAALSQVRASVSTEDLALYKDWNSRYGSGAK